MLYLSHAARLLPRKGENLHMSGEEIMDKRTTVIIADSAEEFCNALSNALQRAEGFQVLGGPSNLRKEGILEIQAATI